MLAPIINVAPTYKIDFMVVNLPQTPEGALEPLRFEWFMNKKIIKNCSDNYVNFFSPGLM
jgi:hypothetical protein